MGVLEAGASRGCRLRAMCVPGQRDTDSQGQTGVRAHAMAAPPKSTGAAAKLPRPCPHTAPAPALALAPTPTRNKQHCQQGQQPHGPHMGALATMVGDER